MSVEENQKHIAEFIRCAEDAWFEPGEPHVLPPRFVRAARLIKAAPELLEACRAVLERWESGDLAGAARMCQSAVEKAEGVPHAT
jgi:hypothetical protein